MFQDEGTVRAKALNNYRGDFGFYSVWGEGLLNGFKWKHDNNLISVSSRNNINCGTGSRNDPAKPDKCILPLNSGASQTLRG